MSALKIGIILGSTRPGRKGEQVARWVLDRAANRADVDYELVDLLDFALPLLDEPVSASRGQYANAHTRDWAAKVAEFDGFIFVTPEYNHSISAALKNAIDYLYAEWNNKSAGFVSYGGASGGTRAVEHLRQIVGELQIADVRQQVALSLAHDFEGFAELKPQPQQEKQLSALFEQVEAWAGALRTLRAEPLSAAA